MKYSEQLVAIECDESSEVKTNSKIEARSAWPMRWFYGAPQRDDMFVDHSMSILYD